LVVGDNLDWLKKQADESFDLIYIDPPFNTGKTQSRTTTTAVAGSDKGHVGFGGRQYERREVGEKLSYDDKFDDFIAKFLGPRLVEAHRLLSPTGSIFVHLDPRESHYAKVFLDELFGRDNFRNEIIWSYDYGARARNRWSAKHDTILWYSKDSKIWTFNYDAIDRIPYMAPGLVGAEKAARGKTPTDVWWNTIVSPTGKEKTGYPTQKPLAILERIVTVHSNPEDRLLDFFAGSGSFGHAAAKHGRNCFLVDKNPAARRTIISRFKKAGLPLTEVKAKP
jgi:site-specific DNA-methyltransferase (adenine-specific)